MTAARQLILGAWPYSRADRSALLLTTRQDDRCMAYVIAAPESTASRLERTRTADL